MDSATKMGLSFRDFTIGTLWWAREKLIAQNFTSWHRNKKREKHPVLSMLKKQPTDDLCFVPMLPGTTLEKKLNHIADAKRNGWIIVKGLEKNAPEHLTVFGEVFESNGGFLVSEFFEFNKKAAKKKSGTFSDVWKIWSNVEKPKCNESEMASVERFYQLHFSNESILSGDYQKWAE